MSELTVRPATIDDLPFIFSTWLRSYRKSAFARSIDNTTFFREHHKLAELLLAKSTTLIAHPTGRPNVIVGYLVTEPSVVHYVYVKHDFKRLAVASTLLAASRDLIEPLSFTHLTEDARYLLAKRPANYNPYKL